MPAPIPAVVFAGPSLWGVEVAPDALVEMRPPAALGDVARAVAQGVRLIGLIDGRFESVPAVWHKELLWALEAGVAIYGGASMGALRAAELAPFGMRVVGGIARDYSTGRLVADDAVAVLHGPAEAGFMPLSTALVDILATLERARAEGVLVPAHVRKLTSCASARFYKERNWTTVMRDAQNHLPPQACSAFRTWLATGRVERKRGDAQAVLAAVEAHARAGAAPSNAKQSSGPSVAQAHGFKAERPHLVSELLPGPARAAGGLVLAAQDRALLDRARLDGQDMRALRREALAARLAREHDGAGGEAGDEGALLDRFRTANGLERGEDFTRWLASRGLDRARLVAVLAREGRLEALAEAAASELLPLIADRLRLLPEAPAALAAAAADLERVEAAGRAGQQRPSAPVLIGWYRTRHRGPDGRALPAAPEALARALGFEGSAQLVEALYARWLESEAATATDHDPGGGDG